MCQAWDPWTGEEGLVASPYSRDCPHHGGGLTVCQAWDPWTGAEGLVALLTDATACHGGGPTMLQAWDPWTGAKGLVADPAAGTACQRVGTLPYVAFGALYHYIL